MIFAIGTDIIDIRRIEKIYHNFGNKFLKRIFLDSEINKASTRNGQAQIAVYAKHFAAKEAIAKSLGCGIGGTLSFLDIEIINDKNGKPCVNLYKFPDINIHLSMSDEYPYAQAFAVAEKI